MPAVEQWRGLWRRLGAASPQDALYEQLLARYSEPHRRYHTVQHLDECLAQFAELEADALHPERIELALWFHDAIYDTKRTDNETKSADWSRAVAMAAQLGDTVADAVHALVMATKHDATPKDADEEVLVDVDLSILVHGPNGSMSMRSKCARNTVGCLSPYSDTNVVQSCARS